MNKIRLCLKRFITWLNKIKTFFVFKNSIFLDKNILANNRIYISLFKIEWCCLRQIAQFLIKLKKYNSQNN